MHTNKASKDEVENVTKFLLQNSSFLENYLVENSTIPFLKSISSRIDNTTNKSTTNKDSGNGIRDETVNTSQSQSVVSKQEKEIDRSCITSPISINIYPDTKEISDKIEDYSALETREENFGSNFKDGDKCQSPPSVVPRQARKSVTSDLFHQWLQNGSSKLDPTRLLESQTSLSAGGTPFPNSPSRAFGQSTLVGKDLDLLEQNDRLMDLILDISNELDINILCHKILLNVGHLTKADRCSLFLARGPREKRYLEAKLFDVDVNTSKLFTNG